MPQLSQDSHQELYTFIQTGSSALSVLLYFTLIARWLSEITVTGGQNHQILHEVSLAPTQ